VWFFNSVFTHYGSWKTNTTPFISAQWLSECTVLNWVLKEQNLNGMDWIHVTQNWDKWQTVLQTVMNLNVPWNGGNFLTIWETVSFSRSAGSCGVTCYQHRLFSLMHICMRKLFIESNRRKFWVPLLFTTLQYICVNRGYLANCYAEEMAKLQQHCRWILQFYWQYLS
jgi:hypothetical protein